ncbi:MAG: hypothetical protein HY718_05365 [Planctomycetes bacterium]|nr:hypothetical protein [Planctomycetota bacterium]
MGSSKSHRTQAIEAMQRNKRMARTLGCLVASMTLGAALLDWVQPKRSNATGNRTELMSIVRQGVVPGNWRSIQLDPEPPGRPPNRSHFVINPDGRTLPTDLWETQQSIGNEGIVRVGLLASDNSNEVTSRQLSAAQALVCQLQNECAIENQHIHYDMLAVPVVPEPDRSNPLPTPPRSSRHR